MTKTWGLTAVAMVAFAANSLLARAALAAGATDPVGFTVLRLVSGAVVLVLLARGGVRGNWGSALALFGYAAGFALAYVRLGAATGALILFTAVQLTMILWGLVRGDRPTQVQGAGIGIAFAALVALLLPGLEAPDPVGSLLMIGAGIAWGAYSLRARGSGDPLGETAGNFVRASVLSLPLLALGGIAVSGAGLGLGLASGVLASGLGYAIWYLALPGLGSVRAAAVQLTVPVIAALGAALLLAEPPGWRLVLCGGFILGGVALVMFAPPRRSG